MKNGSVKKFEYNDGRKGIYQEGNILYSDSCFV
jgi:hypothetical protein